MVEVELGIYLNVETSQDGDIAEILVGSEYGEIESQDGRKKRVLNIPVRIGTKELTYTPPWKIQRLFKESWGVNTDTWIGKKFQVVHRDIEIAGKDLKVVRAILLES